TPQAARLIGTNRDPGDFAVATLEPVGAVGSGLPGQALLAFSRLGAGSPVASLKRPPAVPGAEAHTPAGAPQAAGAAAMGPERPRVLEHTVRRGETLTDIAQQYHISVDTILAANDISDPNMLRIGESLKVLSVDGVLYRVQPGDSLWRIATDYGLSVGSIEDANGLGDNDTLRIGQQLLLPGAQAVAVRRMALVDGSNHLRRAFSWPVRGPISSPFGVRWGRMHEGIDIAVNTGTPVRAAASGRVEVAGWVSGYGYAIYLDNGHGVGTRYGHNSRLLVRVGQRVERGQVIALSGNTGNSTGPHVHFEIRFNGRPVNPLSYVR
ncbi:MAG TPA: M23 family metallopeptidase, partial [Limnochordia bacterium]|nr:M23 family metallopeptidase [Limnochordia bacterium]